MCPTPDKPPRTATPERRPPLSVPFSGTARAPRRRGDLPRMRGQLRTGPPQTRPRSRVRAATSKAGFEGGEHGLTMSDVPFDVSQSQITAQRVGLVVSASHDSIKGCLRRGIVHQVLEVLLAVIVEHAENACKLGAADASDDSLGRL